MDVNELRALYDGESLRREADGLLDKISKYLSDSTSGASRKTIPFAPPSEQYRFWKHFKGGPQEFFTGVIERVNRLHDPRNMGHQVAIPLPLAALSAYVGSQLNNGNAIYEMGMPPSAMERWVCEFMAGQFGFPESSRGFLTSGGSLANLTALLSARKAMLPYDVWNDGMRGQLGILVSAQAHYCVDRAVRIMGMGSKGIVSVPMNARFTIDLEALEDKYKQATARGIHIFALVGSAPSTSTGNYDDLRAMGEFAREKGLWFHVDGAHGGAAILSDKYKRLLDGAEYADSIILDGHKMMMMPSLTTLVLYRNGEHAHCTFQQQADYLFGENREEDWFNLAKQTFECTKNMSGLTWYLLLKTYGKELFDTYITRQYDLAAEFSVLIKNRTDWEIATDPMSNILCFRHVPRFVPVSEMDIFQQWLRQKSLEDGTYYLVETRLHGISYLRVTLMNPFTEIHHLKGMLDQLEAMALEWKDREVLQN